MASTGSNGQVLYTQDEVETVLKQEIARRYPDARGNTPADNGQIVYDEQGMIVRESFGRPLSKLETALCDALDKAHRDDKRKSIALRDLSKREPRTMGHGL